MSISSPATSVERDRQLWKHLEQSPLALVEWDSNMRVSRWSKRAEEIFGWTAAEVVGRRPSEWRFVFESDRARIEDMIAGLQRGDWESRIEHNRNYTRDGRILDCAWYNSVELTPDGKLQSIVSLVLDETLAKQTESQLKRQTARLESALEASRMGCWEWDLAAGRMTWIGHMESIFGYAPGTFDGTASAATERIHPDDRGQALARMETALSQARDYDDEYRVVWPDGEEHWVHVKGRVIYSEDGKPRCLSGTAVETTSRKQDEDRLRRAKESAETSNALKSAFLANMSHEIRTPLGVILGFSELLSDPELGPEERAEYMEVIARNGEHLSRLIDDILDLSKVEANKLEMVTQPTSLSGMIDDLVNHLQAKAKAKATQLSVIYQGRVPQVIEVDPTRFKQIVMNLVGNAIKFTDQGEVRVLVSYDPGSALARDAKAPEIPQPDARLHVRVEDSGIGISVEGQGALFEPFVQADQSPARQYGGTGLGLALSRKIARSMGGEIALASSELHQGSCFDFSIPGASLRPRFDAEDSQARAASGTPHHAGRSETHPRGVGRPLAGLRVLLAEDAVDNQVLLERMLTKRGARLTIVGHGAAAVERALGESFDLVLMDIQMPVLNGYEATTRLRREGCALPIVALTAHAMKDERNRCLEAGCNDHLSKPVHPQELVETILRYAAHRVHHERGADLLN